MNKIIATAGIFLTLVALVVPVMAVPSDISITGSAFIKGNLTIGNPLQQAKLSVRGGTILQDANDTPIEVGGIGSGFGPIDVDVHGKYAYFAMWSTANSFYVVDVTDPANPATISSLTDARIINLGNVAVSGKYAYVDTIMWGGVGNFSVIDISNPAAPAVVGSISINNPGDLQVSGNYVYVVSKGYTGSDSFNVVDVTDPHAPKIVGNLDSDVLSSGASIQVSGRYAYVTSDSGISIVDISNPYSPFIAGTNSGGDLTGGGLFVSGRYAYAAGGISLTVVDVSNATSPIIVSNITNDLINASQFVVVAGKYAYMTAAASGCNLITIDVSNVSSMFIVGSETGCGPFDMHGKYIYMADSSLAHFRIFDLSGIDSPAANIGSLETSKLSVTDNAQVTNDLYVGSGLMIGGGLLAGGPAGFSDRIGQTSAKPRIVGSATHDILGADDGRVFVQGKYAYMTSSYWDTFFIFDVSSPKSPQFISNLTNNSRLANIGDIFIQGGYAYVTAKDNNSFAVIDISNVSSPRISGFVENPSLTGSYSVYVSGKYAYVSSYQSGNGLAVIDISNPTMPKIIGTSASLSYPKQVVVRGKYAYVVSRVDNGLYILDVSNATSPEIVGSYINTSILSDTFYVDVSGRYAYMTSPSNGTFVVLDVSNSSSPQLASYTNVLNISGQIVVRGKYAYVIAEPIQVMYVIDVSDATSPRIGSQYNNSAWGAGTIGFAVSGKYAYVHGSNVLSVIDLGGIDSPAANIGSLETSSLSVTDNAQIGNDLYVGSGLMVGRDALVSGRLAIYQDVTIGAVNSSGYKLNVAGNVNATSYHTNGTDYAEMMEKLDENEMIEAGDIVAVVGGRITKAGNGAVYMIVSENPGVIGGSGDVPVAYVGRVMVKVNGYVNEGDYILADGRGVRQPSFDEFKEKVVGIALESGSGRVMAAVGVK